MLVPFYVDSAGFEPDPAIGRRLYAEKQRKLMEIWKKIGLIITDGRDIFESALYEQIQKLPSDLRSEWLTLLSTLPYVPSPTWDGCIKKSTLTALKQDASLALLDDVTAELEFEIDEDLSECFIADHQFYLTRISAAPLSKPFQSALSFSQMHILQNESYQQIWDTRFRNLARSPIKNVSIVDRYALKNHFLKADASYLSGLERFVKLLDKDATGKKYVSLVSSKLDLFTNSNKGDAFQEVKNILAHLTRRNVKEIKIYIVEDKYFGPTAHDRFIRFGDYVWDIGKGLDVFEYFNRSTFIYSSSTPQHHLSKQRILLR